MSSETSKVFDEPPSATKKKRTSDHQITREEIDASETSENGNEESKLKDGFSRAPPEVLKQRRIIRARWPKGGSSTSGTNGDVTANTTDATSNVKSDSPKTEIPAEVETDKSVNGKIETTQQDEKLKTSPTNESVESSAVDKIPESPQDGQNKSEIKSNPFASFSFATAAKSNPFAALSAKSETEKISQNKDKKTGDENTGGSKEKEEHKIDASEPKNGKQSLDSTSTRDKTNSLKHKVFGSNASTSTLFGGMSSKVGFGSSAFAKQTNSLSTTGFGSTSGSTAPSSLSGSNKSSIFGSGNILSSTKFGTTSIAQTSNFGKKEGNGIFPSTNCENDENTSTTTIMPESVKVSNGEEGENCLFQIRAKLFKLVTFRKEEKIDDESTQEFVGIPPSSNTKDTQAKDDNEEGKQLKRQQEHKNTNATAEKKWSEVGIGPVKILEKRLDEKDDGNGKTNTSSADEKQKTFNEKKSIRVVQRRESAPWGQGTKLILNVSLRSECHVTRQSDKYVKLATFESIQESNEQHRNDSKNNHNHIVEIKSAIPVNYLFKVKTLSDANSLQEALENGIKLCK